MNNKISLKLRIIAELIISITLGYITINVATLPFFLTFTLIVISLAVFLSAIDNIDKINGYGKYNKDNKKNKT